MMQQLVKSLILSVLLFNATAQADTLLNSIAVVDVERAIIQTDSAKKVIDEFKEQPSVKDFDKKRKAYEKAVEEYKKNSSKNHASDTSHRKGKENCFVTSSRIRCGIAYRA